MMFNDRRKYACNIHKANDMPRIQNTIYVIMLL